MPAGLRIETKLPDELIAVHHRHQHVGNHEIEMLSLDGGKPFAAIRRLEHPVSLITQERDQEFPVAREVVNDQDGRPARPAAAAVIANGPALFAAVHPRINDEKPVVSRMSIILCPVVGNRFKRRQNHDVLSLAWICPASNSSIVDVAAERCCVKSRV